MRILHVNSLWPPAILGGAEKVAALIAERQTVLGHEVHAACGVRPADAGIDILNGVTVHRLRHGNAYWQEDWREISAIRRALSKAGEAFNRTYSARFGEVMDGVAPDVVHTHSLVALTPLIWSEAKARSIAVVHTIHGYEMMCTRSMRVRNGQFCDSICARCAILYAGKRRLDRYVDAVVGVSRDVLDRHLQDGYFTALPEARRSVVANPVEPVIATPERTRSGPITFGYLGRISSEKGLDVLIAACRRLTGDWRLAIGGRIPDDIASLLPDRGGDLPVAWLGWTDGDAFLQTVDVLVMPSICPETFGMVTAEALAREVPVIGTRIGATPELIGQDNAQWLVEPNDPQSLALAMQHVIDAGRPVAHVARRAAEIRRLTDPDRIARRYLEIYESVSAAAR